MVDHDRLFKELLQNFFVEFLELFLPAVARYVDRSRLEFLDKEVFTDVTSGRRHHADLVVKTRFRGERACFLVHVEHQASKEPVFAKRMFRYFARLHEKYDVPVYPIAIFSYDAPWRAEPANYRVTFPDTAVLDFRFAPIQLNRLNWRDFARRENPVASALMAKMKIAAEDRPRVKLECLRLLTTLRLNPAKMQLISGFVDQYLLLSGREQTAFRRELRRIEPEQREKVMQLTTSWHREGRREGRLEGRRQGHRALIVRLVQRRFGKLPVALKRKLTALPVARLTALAEAMVDSKFESLDDVRAWLEKKR